MAMIATMWKRTAMMLRASAMLPFVFAAATFPAASSFLAYMERVGGREEGRMDGEGVGKGGRERERKREREERRERREREEREREREKREMREREEGEKREREQHNNV